jgi:hypothetical protein
MVVPCPWPLRAALLVCLACFPGGVACGRPSAPSIGKEGFSDDFARSDLGPDWNNTGGPYSIKDGALVVAGAKNKPLWLKRALPRDARIEFDARSDSPEGDIKVEVYGDGKSFAETTSYTATSYVIIFGGWNNRLNVIARMNEHGDDRVVGPKFPVEPGRTYHFKIERRGDTLRAFVDDRELGTLKDPAPLEGPGHDHFGFNNWGSRLTFDNVKVTAL